MKNFDALKIHIYADGADKTGILDLYSKSYIKGLTTNPTLMKQSGIKDYEAFAKDILTSVSTKPISLEVFTDDVTDMRRQALKIASWGPNVFVKIPITNSEGRCCLPLVKDLSHSGVKLNVTAILTLKQVAGVSHALSPEVPSVVSVFAGRIADTGVDPVPIMRNAKAILSERPRANLLWASVREALNIVQAEESGCDIVTVPHAILQKAVKMFGMDHEALSLDTVKMFASDAVSAGYHL
jgi:transaldolase